MRWQICSIESFGEKDLENAFNSLSASRRKRITSFKKREDRIRSLAGEILIKKILNEEFGEDNYIIECDEKGKPHVSGKEIFISISHSVDMIFCAADRKPLGVDIEKIKPINLKIAEKFATDEELEFIGDSFEKFYEIWTAKEAYFKLKGEDAVNFKSFSVLKLNREVVMSEDYFAQIVK